MKVSYSKIVFVALLGILVLGSCVSKSKKGGEVSKTRMFFHNLTSKYNGYFNADELMFFSELELSEMHQDNYNQILDVYDYVDVDNPKAVADDLDKAIEKVSTVASLHRPSHWLDDCYVLMAKAQYMKHDYESAEETLEYFQEEFDPKNPFGSNFHTKKKSKKQKRKERDREKKEKKKERDKIQKEKKKERKKKMKERKKKRKKKGRRLTKREKEERAKKEATEKEKEENIKEQEKKVEEKKEKKEEEEKAKKPKFYEHKPVYNEGLLWLARTYIARKQWSSAKSILKKIDQSEFYKPKTLEKEVAVTTADLYLSQKEYKAAIPYLTSAIELAKKKKNKARYAYIVAQIYDKLQNYGQARSYYNKVSKMHPPYEMVFNADLNMFKTDLLSGSKSNQQVISKLERMLKEEKNFDYRDQLYFTMGQLAMKRADHPAAIKYFKQSLDANTINKGQKAESYFILAELYFEKEDFYEASMYFDSTKTTMADSDERYPDVVKYAKNLKEIAGNIKTIKLQDSLLTIAGLSKAELNSYAVEILKKEKEKKEEKTKGKGKGKGYPGGKSASGSVISTSSFGSLPSTFFAYHPQQVIKGIETFEDKWGDRELEDNWRRSSKFGSGGDDTDTDSDEEKEEDFTDAEIKRALKRIPLTVGDKKKAKGKIENALYKLGVLYRERLDNCENSTTSLQRLLLEYPETKYRAEACYLLYVCNMNNSALANQYANILKSDYPDSKYTKFLTDPNFLKDYMSANAKVGRYYDATYSYFTNANYQTVRNRIAVTDSLFGKKNVYNAKFALLDAMSQGHTDSKEAYVKALKTVVTKYPNTPEKTRAREILRFLKGDKYAFNEGLSSEKIENFSMQNNRMHYVIVKVNGTNKTSTDDLKLSISSFNKKYYKLDKLKTKDSYLDIQTRTSLILIRRFSNRKKAMDYYETVMKNKSDFIKDDTDYEVFAITQRNYREVLKQKNTDAYKQFFEKNYFSE